jgi:hypothetical protein
LPLTVTLSGGGSTQVATITIPTLRLTDKENVAIELYRTEDDGTSYYKVTNDLSPLMNDTSVDSVNFTDTLSDTSLIAKEALYTTGGVYENVQAPASFQVATYNGDRLAVVGEQANRVYFSKQVTEGFPVEFTDLIYRDTDQVGGPITMIKAMSDKLIATSEDCTYYAAGEGPDNRGQNDTLSNFEDVAGDIGCTEPASAVLTSNGLYYKSRKGIYVLTGNLSLSYIGARVEEYNSSTITSAKVVGQLNQIRFTLSESRALVYNYNLDRWATFENHGARSAEVVGNDYFYLREDGTPYKENRTKFADGSSPIKFRIETGWLSLTGLQGFQRAYKALLLGDFKSAHKLRIKVAYDFKEAWVHEVLINPTDFINDSTYGDDSPYGSGSPYGGDGNLYQMRVDFKQQRCQSIKLLIEDAQTEAGEGLSLSGITIEVGAKAGVQRVPTANQYGTS